MSRSHEYSYQLEREARRRIAAARVSSTTEEFYSRYREQFEELRRRGAAAYIPDEMSRLERDLEQIQSLLISNPFEAREISRTVGSYIHSLHSLSRAAEQQFAQAARLQAEAQRRQAEQQRNAALDEYYRQIQSVPPAIVNFGMEQLQELQKAIAAGRLTEIAQLQVHISSICQQAERQAAEWKRSAQEKAAAESAEKRIQETEKFVRNMKWENGKNAQKFTERIARLRADLAAGKTDDVVSAAAEIESSVEEEKISEEIRRQAVIAIIKQLRSQESVVGKPQLITDPQGETYVKIIAQQPSGRRAACKVDLKGKLQYRFDQYEGMTCLKDIERFQVDLERIYSVKLSDERILWQNPDRLTRDEDSGPAGMEERRRG